MKKIYMDCAATTPVGPAALAAMLPCFTRSYGNPSSIHAAGREASAYIETARETVAGHIGAMPGEIYFTSGGTEADNWALRIAAAYGEKRGKRHIISSAIEHHAILHPLDALKKQGFEVTLLPVYDDGLVRPADLEAALRDDTALVTIQYANNEIGTIQPIAQLGEICRARGVLLHTDAVQAVGHLPIDVAAEQIDMLSLSAHKFHGPKGVGALYCRKGVPVARLMEGGAQERGRRPGTENVPAIVGMAAALDAACADMAQEAARLAALRDRLAQAIGAIEGTRINGSPGRRLPGIVNACFAGIEGEGILLLLDAAGICASSGSACTSGSLEPSHVLLALGLPHEQAHGSLRLSLGRDTTEDEVERVIGALPPIIARLRSISPLWEQISGNRQD